jgi:hypothetical protein
LHWREHVHGTLKVETIPGDYSSIVRESDVAIRAERLNSFLHEAQEAVAVRASDSRPEVGR